MKLNNSYENVTCIDNFNDSHTSAILHTVLQVFLFGLGLFLHVKVIAIARKEKDTTWQIFICHSVVLIIYYSLTIVFDAVMYFVPFLSNYTGNWICYVVSFMTLYCVYSIQLHSLLVAVMKFAFIVHLEKVREFGKSKCKKIFLWINLCFPLFWTVLARLTSDWDKYAFSSLNICFGQHEELLVRVNTTSDSLMKFWSCISGHEAKTGADIYILHTIKQCWCVFASIVNLVMTSNLPEAFFYLKIFRKTRR